MFSLVSGFMNIMLEKPLYKILIIGEEGVGKTVRKNYFFKLQTFLEQLKFRYTGHCTPIDFILPTSGLNRK